MLWTVLVIVLVLALLQSVTPYGIPSAPAIGYVLWIVVVILLIFALFGVVRP